MLKALNILLVGATIAGAAWTFKVKYDAEVLEAEIARVERQAQLERETIALLEADWSLLNQPGRLQTLAQAFQADLALEPIKPAQIVDAADVPARPVIVGPELPDAPKNFADNSRTKVR